MGARLDVPLFRPDQVPRGHQVQRLHHEGSQRSQAKKVRKTNIKSNRKISRDFGRRIMNSRDIEGKIMNSRDVRRGGDIYSRDKISMEG